MATDQFCLHWNNFQVNITSALESLKSDEDLVDVTLTCEGQNVKAHKVILAACSPYFRCVFKENPCQHPVVILKDVKYEDVTALLNFMYHGEVYITQDRLAPFLHTAELLQVRGLTGAGNPFKDFQVHSPAAQPSPSPQAQAPAPAQPLAKAKRSCAPPLRRETPPSAVRGARSPLVTPPPKESAKDPDGDLPAKSALPAQLLPLATPFFTPSDQPPALYSSLNPDLTTALAPPPPVSPTTFQTYGSNSCGQLSPRFSSVSGQRVSQPSSPSAAKRRKTQPRRLSSGNASSAPSEGARERDASSEASASPEAEGAFHEVDVKVEGPSGDEMASEADDDLADAEGGADAAKQEDDGGGAERPTEQDDALLPPGPLAAKLLRDASGGGGGGGQATCLPHVPQCGTCPHCGQTYSNQSALKYHVRLVHTDMTNRHCCHLCPRSFALRDVFKAHMWAKHKQRC